MTTTPQLDAAHDAFGGHDAFGDGESDLDAPPDKLPGSRPPAWIAGGVAAAVIGVGGFFGVGALASHTKSAMVTAGGGPGGFGGFGVGGGVSGTIKSINGSSLVVTTASGSTEAVTTTAETVITKAATGSLSDVKTGDHVVIVGAGTTTVAAGSITDSGAGAAASGPGRGAFPGGAFPGGALPGGALPGGQGGPPGANPLPAVSGTVTEVRSGGLTVTESSGTKVNVTTSPSTTVTNMQTISVSAFAVGQQVRVTGSTSHGTITATTIQEGADLGPSGPLGQGATSGP